MNKPEECMSHPRSWRAVAAVLLTVLGAGCASETNPTDNCLPGVICTSGAAPTVAALNLPSGALLGTSVTFFAKKGEDREGAIFFRNAEGEIEELVDFEVGANSLLTAPNGRAYVDGDSVAITMTLVGSGQLLFDFQPSGLRFNPNDPAELEIEYGDATGGDINGDGVVNAVDAMLTARLAIWLQERTADPFFRLETSFNNATLEEIEADVLGFTRYAIAY